MWLDDTPPIKRRKPAEVAAARAEWERRIALHFERVLQKLGSPEYVESESMSFEFACVAAATLPVSVLKRNSTKFMEKCGYVKLENRNAKNGSWKFGGIWVTVYRRMAAAEIGLIELKQRLGR